VDTPLQSTDGDNQPRQRELGEISRPGKGWKARRKRQGVTVGPGNRVLTIAAETAIRHRDRLKACGELMDLYGTPIAINNSKLD
jgi:hypothetical protein